MTCVGIQLTQCNVRTKTSGLGSLPTAKIRLKDKTDLPGLEPMNAVLAKCRGTGPHQLAPVGRTKLYHVACTEDNVASELNLNKYLKPHWIECTVTTAPLARFARLSPVRLKIVATQRLVHGNILHEIADSAASSHRVQAPKQACNRSYQSKACIWTQGRKAGRVHSLGVLRAQEAQLP